MSATQWLDAPPPTTPGGGDIVPPVHPDLKSTGMAGFTKFTDVLAGWVLLGALAAAIIGLLVFVFGPALGIHSGRRYGTLMMISSVGAAALIGIFAGLINLVYHWFG